MSRIWITLPEHIRRGRSIAQAVEKHKFVKLTIDSDHESSDARQDKNWIMLNFTRLDKQTSGYNFHRLIPDTIRHFLLQ